MRLREYIVKLYTTTTQYIVEKSAVNMIMPLYLLSRKGIFVQPLLVFKVKDGLKIWTKFIEKIKICQWQPNSELI